MLLKKGVECKNTIAKALLRKPDTIFCKMNYFPCFLFMLDMEDPCNNNNKTMFTALQSVFITLYIVEPQIGHV